jgi:hypothetical protein
VWSLVPLMQVLMGDGELVYAHLAQTGRTAPAESLGRSARDREFEPTDAPEQDEDADEDEAPVRC